MKFSRTIAAACTLALVGLSGQAVSAQEGTLDQLKPLPAQGGPISPMFDGWYRNPDGSFTLSFGFINLNREEAANIPIGENNYIEPAEFNGMQPTYFPPVRYPGFGGRHERGAFTVRIPAEMAEKPVVWTIRHNGRTFSIPGRTGVLEYELSYSPATEGSLPPTVRFGNGETVQGRSGVVADPIRGRVGQPITLSIWGQDEGERERKAVNFKFYKYQGPGDIEFDKDSFKVDSGSGEVTTTATFSAPGQYMVRIRVDNFGVGDSTFGNQCCWSNGYIPVTITE